MVKQKNNIIKFNQVRQEVGRIQKRNRFIKSNWQNGIVGVEQPGDDSESQLYQDQQNKVSNFKQRHKQQKVNRLQRKLHFFT